MEEISLVRITNPFSPASRVTEVVSYHGETIADIRRTCAPGDIDFAISINGHVVLPEHWHLTRVVSGDMIVMRPVIEGGDSLKILAMIAIAVVAWHAAPMIAGFVSTQFGTIGAAMAAFDLTMALAPALIMGVGGMLVNALMPAKLPDVPNVPGLEDFDTSQTYSFNPTTTQAQGTTIPRIYGIMKAYGNIISTYTEALNDKNYLNALIALGYGQYKRLYDFKINDQPVENYNGVEIHTQMGKLSQAVIPNFDDTKVEYALGIKIPYGSPHTHATIGNSFDGLEVDIVCAKGLYYQNDRGGLDAHTIGVRVEYRKEGAPSWIIATYETYQYSYQAPAGYWSAGYWPYDDWGQACWYEYERGSSDPSAHYNGESRWVTVWPGTEYESSMRQGTWRWCTEIVTKWATANRDYITISGSQSSAIKRTLRIASNLPHGRYDIRVSKMTSDQTSIRYADDVYMSSVREVNYEDFTYPRQVLAGIKALASDQLSGSLKFSCMVEGAFVRVWTGSAWSIEWSDNPAWVCYDVLTQPVFDDALTAVLRYDGIDPSRIDHEAFKVWADFCDELVDDGNGGTEKRFLFNGTFDTEMTLWEAAMKIAQMSRALPFFKGYQITVVVDKAASPVQLFTAGNVVQDSFKETFLPIDERAGEIEISYVNQDNDYARDTLTVINSVLNRPSNRVSLQLMGVTKASQAWRSGQFQLLCNQHLKRTIDFEADIDAIACTLGDPINFAHSVPKWGLASGRIVSATNTPNGRVTLDQEVILDAGKTYVIMLRLDDDTLVTKTISDGAGTYTTLNLTTVWDSIPTPYCPFAMGENGYEVKPFRVLDISRTGDQKASIKAIEYNESIYGGDTGIPVIPTPNYSTLESLPSVSSLDLKEQLKKRADGTIITIIDVSFVRPASNLWDHVEIWLDSGGGWSYHGRSYGGLYSIENVTDKATYQIAVLSVNKAGNKETIAAAPKASLYVFGKSIPPEDIAEIWAEAAQGGLKLTWQPVGDIDLSFYKVRWTSDLATGSWSNSLDIGIAKTSTITIPAARNGRYYVKAVDTSGNESMNAIAVETTIPTILGWNVQETQVQEPDWLGTKTNMIVVDEKLLMDSSVAFDDIADFDAVIDFDYGGSVVAQGIYETESIDLGSVQTARCSVEFKFNVVNLDDLFDDILDFDLIANFDGTDNTNAGVIPQIALSQDGSTWGDWQNFIAGDYAALAFKMRLVCFSLDTRSRVDISNASLIVDMPDREKASADVVCPAGGLSVSFDKPFMIVPRIGITAQGLQAGDYYALSNKSVNGFDIIFKNSGGVGVQRTMDWAAKGY